MGEQTHSLYRVFTKPNYNKVQQRFGLGLGQVSLLLDNSVTLINTVKMSTKIHQKCWGYKYGQHSWSPDARGAGIKPLIGLANNGQCQVKLG